MLDEAVFTAGDLMTRDVAVAHPETTLLNVVKLMASRRISGVPGVDDDGVVVGMLTEGDLVRWHEGYTPNDRRAGSICWLTGSSLHRPSSRVSTSSIVR